MNPDQVILVDQQDQETGLAEKMSAHLEGRLHRAFSVFILSESGDMLLQRRAIEKYHCGGLWTNACCSHPRPGESVEEAAYRRMQEELGIRTELSKAFDFIYRAEFANGLIEHEFDHVMVGRYNGPVPYNRSEIMDIAWLPVEEIKRNLETDPHGFTPWFRIAFPGVTTWWEEQLKLKNI